MLILSLTKYKEPDKSKSKTNSCWRDFAQALGIKTSDLVEFLTHVNVVKRIPIKDRNFTRIESTVTACAKGLTETFFIKKSKGGGTVHCAQTKLTPKGVKELKRLYKKEFKELKSGVEVSKVIENSTSMIFPNR